MCGIAGIWRKHTTPTQSQLEKMTSFLKRRGPDADGLYLSENIGLAHTRLKILDLSDDSNQPFYNDHYSLIFNGRIFNYKELREELKEHYHFKTTGDTEVLFYALIHWNEQALKKLDGQFAFAFYNKSNHQLILARDHVGICPLYIYQEQDELIFSSEIKPILSQVKTAIDPQGVADFLHYRYNIQNNYTLFKNIKRFPPAHYMILDLSSGESSLHRYWEMKSSEKSTQFNDTLDQAISNQQSADVPVGMYLSGGIDSTAILKGFSKNSEGPIKSYTIQFTDDDPEIDRVDQLQKEFNFKKEIIDFPFEYLDEIEKVIYHLEDPFADLIVTANYKLAEFASKDVKVVLSGEGGDESFCGYDHQRAFMKILKLCKIPFLKHFIVLTLKLLPPSLIGKIQSYPGKFSSKEKNKLIQLVQNIKNPGLAYTKLVQLFPNEELVKLINPTFYRAPDTKPIEQIFNKEKNISQAILKAEIEQLTLITNLTKQDRMAMSFGLEACVPLVSKKILEYASTLSENELFPTKNKDKLIDYSGISLIKKRPFSLFQSEKYVSKLLELYEKYVTKESIHKFNILNWDYTQDLKKEISNGTILGVKQAMTVLIFCIWCETFFENQESSIDF